MKDLSSYLNNDFDFNNIKFNYKNRPSINTDQLLLMIIPPQSIKIIKPEHRYLYTDIDSNIIHIFPTKFKLEKQDKKYDWMYEPIIPIVEINDILDLKIS